MTNSMVIMRAIMTIIITMTTIETMKCSVGLTGKLASKIGFPDMPEDA